MITELGKRCQEMTRIEEFASFKSELLGALGGPRPLDQIASPRYFEIHVHKKCTKLTPEELKAIALMSLVTHKKNSI
jgi:hypothetical protein